MEKALADAMCSAEYEVLSSVNCLLPLDEKAFVEVRQAFAEKFRS
jgi:hypothetical protein